LNWQNNFACLNKTIQTLCYISNRFLSYCVKTAPPYLKIRNVWFFDS
jgi:hypothetical protein